MLLNPVCPKIIFQHVIHIKTLERCFAFFFFNLVSKIQFVFYTYSTSQFRLTIFQVFNSPMWLLDETI